MIELKCETIWFEQRKYEEAESLFYQSQSAETSVNTVPILSEGSQPSSIVDQIAKARETIQQTLKGVGGPTSGFVDENVVKRLSSLENENQQLNENIKNVQSKLTELEKRIAAIEIPKGDQSSAPKKAPPSSKPEIKDDDDDDDDDEDLFGSDDDAEVEKLKEIRLAEYAAKKAKKPAVIAKSNIILDVKPWDDETDMAVIEEKVRSITFEGLLWGASKLVPVGYGIKKLQISCVVEDDKVRTDDLEEAITAFDLVQSMDIAAFNKV